MCDFPHVGRRRTVRCSDSQTFDLGGRGVIGVLLHRVKERQFVRIHARCSAGSRANVASSAARTRRLRRDWRIRADESAVQARTELQVNRSGSAAKLDDGQMIAALDVAHRVRVRQISGMVRGSGTGGSRSCDALVSSGPLSRGLRIVRTHRAFRIHDAHQIEQGGAG